MCRSITRLYNVEPPVTDDEIQAASLQFARKISGINRPSKANEAQFGAAVEAIAAATRQLLDALETKTAPQNRVEALAKRRARAAERRSNT